MTILSQVYSGHDTGDVLIPCLEISSSVVGGQSAAPERPGQGWLRAYLEALKRGMPIKKPLKRGAKGDRETLLY